MPKVIAIPLRQDELARTLRAQGYTVQTVDHLQGPVDAILYEGGANEGDAGFEYDDLTPVNDLDLNTIKSAMLIDIGGRSPRETTQLLTRRLGVY
ncbi:MAG: hypothetical protein ACM3ZQ_07285 [Bacillota bacterium]